MKKKILLLSLLALSTVSFSGCTKNDSSFSTSFLDENPLQQTNFEYVDFYFHFGVIKTDHCFSRNSKAYLITDIISSNQYLEESTTLENGNQPWEKHNEFISFVESLDESFFEENNLLVTMVIPLPTLNYKIGLTNISLVDSQLLLDYCKTPDSGGWFAMSACFDAFIIEKETQISSLKMINKNALNPERGEFSYSFTTSN